MPIFSRRALKERTPGIPTTDPLGRFGGRSHYVGACLRHGPADNRGHVRSLPDTSIPLSAWRNAEHPAGLHRLVFLTTEAVIGATPGHNYRDH